MVDKVYETGVPNYKEARIELQTNLNLPLWRQKLESYRDKHILMCLPVLFTTTGNEKNIVAIDAMQKKRRDDYEMKWKEKMDAIVKQMEDEKASQLK